MVIPPPVNPYVGLKITLGLVGTSDVGHYVTYSVCNK